MLETHGNISILLSEVNERCALRFSAKLQTSIRMSAAVRMRTIGDEFFKVCI